MSVKIELIAAQGCDKCVAAQEQLRAFATAELGDNEVAHAQRSRRKLARVS